MCILKEEKHGSSQNPNSDRAAEAGISFTPCCLLAWSRNNLRQPDNWRNLPKNSLISSFFTNLPCGILATLPAGFKPGSKRWLYNLPIHSKSESPLSTRVQTTKFRLRTRKPSGLYYNTSYPSTQSLSMSMLCI